MALQRINPIPQGDWSSLMDYLFNPAGVSAITVGGSPFTYTAGGTPEAVYLTAGTVSLIVKNGVTLFTATPATVYLAPGESIVVTYSLAPTMNRDKK